MNRKICLILLLILPALIGCETEDFNNIYPQGNFYIGNSENKVIELTNSELSAKINVEMDTFFLATHKGDACTCWTGFQYVMQQYNEQKGSSYIPFFGFDTDLLPEDNPYDIKPVTSGYVDFYVIVEGKVEKRYTKSAKLNFDMFEKADTFTEIVDKHINERPIYSYAYVSYERACDLIIDKNANSFVLLTIRSGCGDCNYCMPKVVTPWLKENGTKIPVYVCDIEKYRGTDEYNSVKNSLNLTFSASESYGYGEGVVPTYQYYVNGVLTDAGVYANDTFKSEGEGYTAASYFDGKRDLKYTNRNLEEEFSSSNDLSSMLAKVGNSVYLPTEKEAVFHDSILKEFLSYYCK